MTTERGATSMLLSRRRFLALSAAAALAARAGPARAARLVACPGAEVVQAAALTPALTPSQRASIVHVKVHPGVGIMRVGNSEDAFYFGPEVVGAMPPSDTPFRDGLGAVARQAARFRLYGYDAGGKVVGEITNGDADIDWGVHLANRKASWYQFSKPMDIPEAVSASRRNSGISNRGSLAADAGLHHSTEATSVDLTASMKGLTLLLGEMMTDESGRLVVLPGLGKAQTWNASHLITYANNDGWVDDMADGPVTATIDMDGRVLEAESAWVASGPPNFAPGFAWGWRTLHDILEDVWVSAGMMAADSTVSFTGHILPLFVRLADLQWVNAGILRDYGWNSPEDLSAPALISKLADGSLGNRTYRRNWVKRFRNLDSGSPQPKKLPPILGDAISFPSTSPRSWIGPTDLQRAHLHAWGEGDFDSDGLTMPAVPASLSAVPLKQRPNSLDRSALEACLGDAFHPGCELTWPVRHASMWDAPYRLALRGSAEPDYGPTLTPAEVTSHSGPLRGNFPGSLTRWLAVPWMTDTINCLSGYQPSVDPYLDTFWPARVPNQVLTEADYAIVMDTTKSLTTRKNAFKRRRPYFRGMMVSNYHKTLTRMSNLWPRLGFVVRMPGPGSGPFPLTFAVEVDRTLPEPTAAEAAAAPTVLLEAFEPSTGIDVA